MSTGVTSTRIHTRHWRRRSPVSAIDQGGEQHVDRHSLEMNLMWQIAEQLIAQALSTRSTKTTTNACSATRQSSSEPGPHRTELSQSSYWDTRCHDRQSTSTSTRIPAGKQTSGLWAYSLSKPISPVWRPLRALTDEVSSVVLRGTTALWATKPRSLELHRV